jgi:hypothetical protein
MIKSARIRIAILALMLAVSHVALISHVTAHFEPGLDQCELCVSQAQLLTAIPAADHSISMDSQAVVSHFDTPTCAKTTTYRFAFRQRAPPNTSS